MLNDFIAFFIFTLATVVFMLVYYGIIIPEQHERYKNKIRREYERELQNLLQKDIDNNLN